MCGGTQAMTDRQTLAALVERVEQATGLDRELDAEIAWLMHPSDRKRLGSPDLRRECFHLGLPEPQWVPWESVSSFHPHYTSSLDAALTLVPEGMAWTVLAISGADAATHSPSAVVTRQAGNAATPALALVAAALRARMEEMGDD